MALTADVALSRLGPPGRGIYGYPVSTNEQLYRGSLVGITAAGTMQRIQTAGCVAFLGISAMNYNNTGTTTPSTQLVEALRGIYALTVPAATPANINAPVYATDDNTLTLTNTGSLLEVGFLDGFVSGQTYVRLLGA